MSRTITILGQTFEVKAPYAAGHQLTEVEANVLNQVRAENIGNNIRAKVKEANETEDAAEKEAKLKEVHAKVAEYDEKYEFNMTSGRGSGTTLSPLEKMAEKIAKQQLRMVLSAQTPPLTLKAYTEEHGEDYVTAKIAEIAAMEGVQAEAKKQLKEEEARAKRMADIAVTQ